MPKTPAVPVPARVIDYMTAGPYVVHPDQSLATAEQTMRRHDIRHLPVVSGDGVVGVLSQRDVTMLLAGGTADLENLPIGDFMSAEVFEVSPQASIAAVVEKMANKKLGSAIVVEHGKVVGIFTTVDALRALVELARPYWAEVA